MLNTKGRYFVTFINSTGSESHESYDVTFVVLIIRVCIKSNPYDFADMTTMASQMR